MRGDRNFFYGWSRTSFMKEIIYILEGVWGFRKPRFVGFDSLGRWGVGQSDSRGLILGNLIRGLGLIL